MKMYNNKRSLHVCAVLTNRGHSKECILFNINIIACSLAILLSMISHRV